MSKAKQKGTMFETKIVNYLSKQNENAKVTRLALSGNRDIGDVAITFPTGQTVLIEAKNHRAVSIKKLKDWKEELLQEVNNYSIKFADERIVLACLVISLFNSPLDCSLVIIYNSETDTWEIIFLHELTEKIREEVIS